MKKESIRLQVDVDRKTYETIQLLKRYQSIGRTGGEVVDRAIKDLAVSLGKDYAWR